MDYDSSHGTKYYHSLPFDSFIFSIYTVPSSENTEGFISSFPVLKIVVLFPCPLAPVSILSVMLNTSSDGGHSCLIPDVREESFQHFTFKHYVCCRFYVKSFSILKIFLLVLVC